MAAEARVIFDAPSRRRADEDKPLKSKRRRIRVAKSRIIREAEAEIIGRISEHYASRGAFRTKPRQSFDDQGLSDATPLPVRTDGDWTKAVPAACAPVDQDR